MVDAGRVESLFNTAVAAGDVPGLVAMVADGGGPLLQVVSGVREVGKPAAMLLDTLFWLASMTKPLTAVAAMQLVERGQLELDAPASRVIAELGELRVLDGFDAAGQPRLRAPKRPLTLRHLLTHTSGFSQEHFNADVLRYQQVTGALPYTSFRNAALHMPLMFDPGHAWAYGISSDWVGKMIEAASGTALDHYMQRHVLAPLGMRQTTFEPSPAQLAGKAAMHTRRADGGLERINPAAGDAPEFFSGGAGLYGTAPDYLRFVQMILQLGTLDGVRILQPETVRQMCRNQIGDLNCDPLRTTMQAVSQDVAFFPGMPQRWGMNFLINTRHTAEGVSAGSLCWGGIANTFFWIDLQRRLAGVFMTQLMPFFDRRARALFLDFQAAVNAMPLR